MRECFLNMKTIKEWKDYLICSEKEIKTLIRKGTLTNTPYFKEEYDGKKGHIIKARLYNHKFLNQ